ncbi:uncharacterized protein LOC100908035 [Galendromus occidentalis]|uniref:Uncharacterized protein LOC100908035 n=1 Tax=Galendromus occidentalis TaxID=34638 RepID=A0AAJ7SFU5_9ACAR|nr:uncharacterized protein LOC100908035 [Galendromus occidentalis]
MLRTNSWRNDGRVRFDEIDLFLFGPKGVGIRSLMHRWIPNQHSRTLVLDGRRKRVRILAIQDESQLKHNINISRSRPHGVLFVFDVSCSETFYYMIPLLEKAKPIFNSNTIRYLVGTKRDLRQDEPGNADEVILHEAVMLAMRNLMRYRESSAVTGEGVEGAFMSIIKDVHKLGLRLETQSLMANLGSYMSLPRKGNETFHSILEHRPSIDSDSWSVLSDVASSSEPGEPRDLNDSDTHTTSDTEWTSL